MSLTIIHGDITAMKTDAIVNAANARLKEGGGVCGAIFAAAGRNELGAACKKLRPVKTGGAVITPGFNLPSKHIIHAVGPVYRGGKRGEEGLLRSAYINALTVAVQNGCKSVAFPLISSGIYGYPEEEAMRVAVSAINYFIADCDVDVTLVLYDGWRSH